MCWGTCHIEPSHTRGPCRCATQPQPHTAFQLRFAVAFAITFTTATLLRSASLRLLPRRVAASYLSFHPNPSRFPRAGRRHCCHPLFPALLLQLFHPTLITDQHKHKSQTRLCVLSHAATRQRPCSRVALLPERMKGY